MIYLLSNYGRTKNHLHQHKPKCNSRVMRQCKFLCLISHVGHQTCNRCNDLPAKRYPATLTEAHFSC